MIDDIAIIGALVVGTVALLVSVGDLVRKIIAQSPRSEKETRQNDIRFRLAARREQLTAQ